MYFLLSSYRWHILAGFAAAMGAAAYSMPLVGSSLLLLLPASGVSLLMLTKRPRVFAVLLAIVCISVLTLHLSAPVAVAAVSAASIGLLGSPMLGVAVLWLHSSLLATSQEALASALFTLHLEAAGPALVTIFMLWLTKPQEIVPAIGALVAALALTSLAVLSVAPPEALIATAALPACVFAGWCGWQGVATSKREGKWALFALVASAAVIWAYSPPRTFSHTAVLLPDAPEAFEAKYFKNYADALQFAGVNAQVVRQPEDIRPGSLVLLPWLTHPLGHPADNTMTGRFAHLARERRWTVIVAGEHTNMGSVAERAQALSGKVLLRRDLTVPPGNTDRSGPLRALDFRGWLNSSLLNRGASVPISSVADRVLLTGDGWWAEPDIGEWLWVGDYVWDSKDRGGRIALAASIEAGGARWITIGDNTPFINSQLYADPRAVKRIIELASLWPPFLLDLALVLLSAALCVGPVNGVVAPEVRMAAVGAAIGLAMVATGLSKRTGHPWADAYVRETGHDSRNFNVALAERPELWKGRRLVRIKYAVSGMQPLPKGRSIIFLLVDGSAEIGGIKLTACRRLGALETGEGPRLMDAQACRVHGENARVLIGQPDQAAAIAIETPSAEAIVVLDIGFLSQNAPITNTEWLLAQAGK